jgi:hypothetical protein
MPPFMATQLDPLLVLHVLQLQLLRGNQSAYHILWHAPFYGYAIGSLLVLHVLQLQLLRGHQSTYHILRHTPFLLYHRLMGVVEEIELW